MQDLDRITDLIAGHLRKELSEAEQTELEQWVQKSQSNSEFFLQATNEEFLSGLMVKFGEADRAGTRLRAALNRKMGGKLVRMQRPNWRKYVAAASVIIVVVSGAYFFSQEKKTETAKTPVNHPIKKDLPPGREGAALRLADGTIVVLDSAKNGNLAVQGGTKVVKLDNGQLAYRTDKGNISDAILYNELYTDRGRQFQVSLPDGSHVWLNASSSIRYPTSFTGKDRTVEITGEAYFEVAHDALHPFHVKVSGMDVQVLGTHFNINSYQDEGGTKTTLLEGKVKIINSSGVVLLKPGQQAQATTGQLRVVNDVDLETAVAWKNGYFNFKKESIQIIMRQLSRWYDVNIEYKDSINKKFYAEIPRSSNVSVVFEVLQATGGIHFEIEGKKIIVTK